MPLTQHTMPELFGIRMKSYIEWPHWEYRRVGGLGKVELNDIVVFNYPAGDSICTAPEYQTEYYSMCYTYGEGIVGMPELDSISAMERIDYYKYAYSMGRKFIADANFRKAVCDSKGWEFMDFGEIGYRPTDRRENYVKRCVGLPGQTLEIKDRIIYLDGKENKTPENAQFTYFVKLNNISIYDLLGDFRDGIITSDILGCAFEPEQRFENPDGSAITFDRDYFGSHRGLDALPGPFADAEAAEKALW
jgi:signal peptidase I